MTCKTLYNITDKIYLILPLLHVLCNEKNYMICSHHAFAPHQLFLNSLHLYTYLKMYYDGINILLYSGLGWRKSSSYLEFFSPSLLWQPNFEDFGAGNIHIYISIHSQSSIKMSSLTQSEIWFNNHLANSKSAQVENKD